MSTALLAPTIDQLAPAATTEPRVVHCYSVFDAIFPACGFIDLTDGMYGGTRRALTKPPRPGRQKRCSTAPGSSEAAASSISAAAMAGS